MNNLFLFTLYPNNSPPPSSSSSPTLTSPFPYFCPLPFSEKGSLHWVSAHPGRSVTEELGISSATKAQPGSPGREKGIQQQRSETKTAMLCLLGDPHEDQTVRLLQIYRGPRSSSSVLPGWCSSLCELP